jgi:hypothetical protein
MKVILQIEHGKDATGENKRAMWIDIITDIVGMERITSVAELPEDSPLGKEVDFIVTEMLALKKKELKAKMDSELAAKKKKK